jgi:glucose dehydrogenase
MKLRLMGLTVLLSGAALAAQSSASRQIECPSVGGDPGNAKSSPLSEINLETVERLKVAWQWKHREGSPTRPLRAQRLLR